MGQQMGYAWHSSAEEISPSEGCFVLLIFQGFLAILCWNCCNIAMYWSDWRGVFNLGLIWTLTKCREAWKALVCKLILSQTSGFWNEGHAMEPLFCLRRKSSHTFMFCVFIRCLKRSAFSPSSRKLFGVVLTQWSTQKHLLCSVLVPMR